MTKQASNLDQLSDKIGYAFHSKQWLQLAVTHRSAKGINNERLEFLGDSILGMIIAEALFQKFPNATEGELSRLRSFLVRGKSLTSIAHHLELGDYLQLGSGELKSGGKHRDSILEDAVEAIIGAIFLDGGFTACQTCVLNWFAKQLATLKLDEVDLKDPKSRLQEYVQGKGQALPVYKIESIKGSSHAHEFTVRCTLNKQNISTIATGTSRRRAEQAAAKAVLALLNNEK